MIRVAGTPEASPAFPSPERTKVLETDRRIGYPRVAHWYGIIRVRVKNGDEIVLRTMHSSFLLASQVITVWLDGELKAKERNLFCGTLKDYKQDSGADFY